MQTEVTDVENIDENSIDGWQTVTVDEAFEFTRKPRSLDIPEGEPIPFIPMDGISESSRKIDYAESLTMEEIKSGSFVFKDDLLVAKITPSFENGKQAILDDLSNDYGYATTEVWVLHPKEDVKIFKEYLFYYLRRGKIRSDLAGKMEGSTGRQRLPKGVLKSLELNSPPLNEQQKIVSVLNTVQDTIEQTEAVIQATRELKKSMMKHLFTYGPVPVNQTDQVELEETDIGEINSDWSIGILEDHTETRYGYTESAEEESIGPKYLRITDISDEGFIDWHSVPYCKINEEDLEKYKVKPGDIYVARIGATTGKTCYIEKERNAVFASYLIRLKVLDSDRLIPEYLYRYTQSKLYWDQLNAQKDGKLKKGISASALSSFKIPIPTLDTQKNIARRINIIENKLVNEINKKKSLEILFNSLLESLMTAKIRVA